MGYMTIGNYDFDIEPNAIISDQVRFEAIRQGAQKGLDAFVAQVAAQGANPSGWRKKIEQNGDLNITREADEESNPK